MNKLDWVEEEDRNCVAIWVGSFDSESEFRSGVTDLYQALGLPDSENFRDLSSNARFGDDPVAALWFSMSYYENVARRLKEMKSRPNAAVAVFNFLADDVPAETGPFAFAGFFDMDSMQGEVASAPDAVETPGRLSVWAGKFDTRKELDAYFGLPDHIGDSDGTTGFTREFQIASYERDFGALETSDGLKPIPLQALTEKTLLDSKIRRAVVAAGDEQRQYNFIYVAYRFDYEATGDIDALEYDSGEWIQFLGAYNGDIPKSPPPKSRKKKKK